MVIIVLEQFEVVRIYSEQIPERSICPCLDLIICTHWLQPSVVVHERARLHDPLTRQFIYYMAVVELLECVISDCFMAPAGITG